VLSHLAAEVATSKKYHGGGGDKVRTINL
jgi:hypothetical protein